MEHLMGSKDMDDKDGKTDAEQSGTNTIDRCEVPLPKRSTTNFTSSLRSSGPKQRPITSNIGGQQDLKRETNGDSKSMRLVRPRIPKTDFRRNYSIMWANVFNSCDKSIMLKHLQHFYHPDVSVTQRDVREDHTVSPQKIPHFQQSARGTAYLSQLWYAGMTAAPDMACILRHTFVKVRADGSAVVRCCFALKGTMVAEAGGTKRADVAKIARYQALKTHSKRDMTHTEAAVAAVAPESVVLASSLSRLSTDSAESGESRPMSSRRQSSGDAGNPRGVFAKKEKIDEEEDIDMSGTAGRGSHPKDATSDGTEGAKMTSSGGVSSRLDRRTDQAPAGAANSRSSAVKEGAAKPGIDWLAFADYAYTAGTLAPCLPRSQKRYHYSQEYSACQASAEQDDGAAGMDDTTTNNEGTDSIAGIGGTNESCAGAEMTTYRYEVRRGQARSSSPGSVEGSAVLTSTAETELTARLRRRAVLTASIDCVCGIEFEFSPEGSITSVALHYFR